MNNKEEWSFPLRFEEKGHTVTLKQLSSPLAELDHKEVYFVLEMKSHTPIVISPEMLLIADDPKEIIRMDARLNLMTALGSGIPRSFVKNKISEVYDLIIKGELSKDLWSYQLIKELGI